MAKARAAAMEYFAKVWIYGAQALIFGVLGGFNAIQGPLFLFDVVASADGRPTTGAGVAMCIMSVPFLALFALGATNLAFRLRPTLRICREGLEAQVIGASALSEVPLVPPMFRLIWLLLSGAGFRRRIYYIPWEFSRGAEIGGLPMSRELILHGVLYSTGDASSSPCGQRLNIHEIEFTEPLQFVVSAIIHSLEDRQSRLGLPSWHDPPRGSSLFF
jgi:hypothetical protein